MKAFFGDNQFLGVNHSQGKGGIYLDKYQTPEDVAVTLKDAWNAGIRDFFFTVNPKTVEAINLIIKDYPFNLHPALPYAHTVNALILEKGLVGAMLAKGGHLGFFNLLKAGVAAAFGKFDRGTHLMILSELDGIPMQYVKSIGLLNIATDFLLGLNRVDLIQSFYSVVQDKFSCKPMYYTMNFPMLASKLWDQGYEDCGIIFNYNKSGFRTNPTLKVVEQTIAKCHVRETIAMSLFSGGNPDEMEAVLSQVPALSGVLFGSSSKENIENNLSILARI